VRVFYDTEFVDRGAGFPIDLISIGLVREDGAELYLQSCDWNEEDCPPFVREQVLPKLETCPWGSRAHHAQGHRGRCGNPGCPWRTRAQLAGEILDFATQGHNEQVELWADYAAYDHVVLAQSFGTFDRYPSTALPFYTHDIRQLWVQAGRPALPEYKAGAPSEHNALSDARLVRDRHLALTGTGGEVLLETALGVVEGETGDEEERGGAGSSVGGEQAAPSSANPASTPAPSAAPSAAASRRGGGRKKGETGV
jgi:hypothetical protein